jgi:hypothetical protein
MVTGQDGKEKQIITLQRRAAVAPFYISAVAGASAKLALSFRGEEEFP